MISVILLAGGKGTRMGSETPKQFLSLNHYPIARYSFDLFLQIDAVQEIVVVCHESYHHHFQTALKPIIFADPGERRQDSVFNGLQKVSTKAPFVCVHDAARPFIKRSFVEKAIEEAYNLGAAAIGMPVKHTVKLSYADGLVEATPDRTKVWEIHTPQVIKKEWLVEGFAYAQKKQLTVTDDVSLVELLGKPVKLVQGDYTNIKITTPEDLVFAEMMLKNG